MNRSSGSLRVEIMKEFPQVLSIVIDTLNVHELPQIISYAFDILDSLFEIGKNDSSLTDAAGTSSANEFFEFFERSEGLKRLDDLTNHRDENCLKRSVEFMEQHF